MKNYCYFIVGKYIIKTFARKVKNHPGRFSTYIETNQQLYDRAEKYGYIQINLT